MTKYLLFDLDGTLLPVDTESFISTYVKSVTRYFSRLIDPQLFSRQLMASSYAMIGNLDPGLTNQEKFMADFFQHIGYEPAELMPLFAEYYERHYHEVRAVTRPTPLARQIVEDALKRGLKVVLATNPVFPREAIAQRMAWAGIADLPWELVTSYEDTHFCKPNIQYYAEVLERIGAKPEECVHIGNDMDEDFPASEIGIRVAIVDDCLINPSNRPLADCHFHGSLRELAQWLDG